MTATHADVPRLIANPLRNAARLTRIGRPSAAFHRSLPGYAPTPLRSAPAAAAALGVARVLVKDESERLGMPSFKILGASWAAYRVLLRHVGLDLAAHPDLERLRDELRRFPGLSLTAATDGNHGRAVARMGALLGLPVHIFVPDDMVAARIAAIEGEGASVEVVDGGYDDAIRRSADAVDARTLVVSDTSWEGYTEPPAWVIEGYSTLIGEIADAIADGTIAAPTVVAAQIGVGAFAAAVARGFGGSAGTRVVGVEPVDADCTTVSIERGVPTTIPGPQRSIMAGLNCGTPSLVAWPDVSSGFDAFCTVTDAAAEQAMRLLHRDGIVSGESGAAGLAGMLVHRDALGLSASDTVLVFSTEGATDVVAYNRICETELS
ncbi:diaminopropionate ammonia-lyase [Microbacterium rhizophilus]|uniref:diaminopropionate ammonia-lyase n=1 Tax=Microbacterium rhizophilus TaxID=3138934 RepID=UPI0031F0E791